MSKPAVSVLQKRGFRLGAAFLAGAMQLVLILSPAAAQRQRQLPPEPSRQPWITAQSEQWMAGVIGAFEKVVAAGGWKKIPGRGALRPGDSHGNVAILRRRLEITGDVAASGSDSYLFDAALAAGVKQYQLRNGLEPTGVVYGITLRSLNVSAEVRLRQLRLNLARMRELLPSLAKSPRYILMNSASFELQAISGGQVALTSRTIAGKRRTPTPTVSASIRAINVLPYWHVPRSIAKRALIPHVRKDPGYFYKQRIRVFSSFGGEEVDPSLVNWWGPEAQRYAFRQEPGPQNALGVLRFDMPNKHIVYMHDTPMKTLYNYFERAYSAGCVRMQNFLNVAEWVLAGEDGWTRPAIEAAIKSNKRKTIKVRVPVPVHFIYLTAWVADGTVQFRNDLYNRDEKAFDGGADPSARMMVQTVAP
jgi:L,D-transpeptidase YcbB